MDNLKSMIFGAKPRAVKWLGMGTGDGDDHEQQPDRMFVHPEAATEVLQPLADQPINLISIFGAARQGKSFLMNLLADQQDLFKISNLREPCTQGVDLSGHFLPLSKFSALNGCPPIATSKSDTPIQIGFVDAEGQGDRDITYDSRLVSPVLLSSKVVLFNWKDSLQADRILNLLAVLARAAQGIELADGNNSKVFGHLHIVFRDWSFVDSSPQDVYNDLFAREKGRSEEVNVRNLARSNLVEAFESITVWLFPAPVANTANLRDKIRFEQLEPSFQEKLRDLRKCLSNQLQHSMKFGGKPLTARLLSQMMPLLVDTLNSDEVIMPESIYSSMVRAQAKSIKDQFEQRIADHCEAAGIEEIVAADEFEKMLHGDVEFIITEAMDALRDMPASVQKEMQAALKEFAAKEIKIAVHTNNEKIAQRVSKEVDVIFENLKTECQRIEDCAIPMRSDLLKQQCSDILKNELNRLEILPVGTQGRRGIEVEMNRVRQHASIMFDKLEVTNEKAIQRANAKVNDHARNGKTNMTKAIHEQLDKVFSVRTPVTVATLQADLDGLYRDLISELKAFVAETPFVALDFMEDVEHHKSHLAEELNRRYYLEIRQILSEVGFTAKEDLGKEVALRLDGKLPLSDDLIKQSIDEAVQQVKYLVAQQLQGWTVLKSDVTSKSMELEKLGDVYAYEYLRRNQELQKDVSARQEEQQYEDLKSEVIDEFQRELKSIEFPTSDTKIDSIFTSTLKDMIAEFMTLDTTSASFSATVLFDKLTADCKPDLENQKIMNRLAVEKKEALTLAQREREARERENQDARKKEEQINELKTYVERSIEERDSEAKRLQAQLRAEADRARQLREEVEEMKRKAAEAELKKREIEHRAQLQALQEESARREESEGLKRQLEELRLKAAEMELERQHLQLQAQAEARKQDESRQLAMSVDQLRRRAAELEAEKYALEARAREEAQRREVAENAACAAAEAAALSARAAIEAAASEADELEAMEVDYSRHTPESARRPQRSSDIRPSPAGSAEHKRRKTQSTGSSSRTPPEKSPGGRSALEEARRQAQADVERRIQERSNALKQAAKKKK